MNRRNVFLALSSLSLGWAGETRPCRLIAHRGACTTKSEENSAEALEEAIRRGYWMVEIDLRQSSDGTIILSHDLNLKRVFGRDVNVHEMTWRQMKSFKTSKTGSALLTFESAVELIKGRAQLWLDIKDPVVTEAFLRKVEKVIVQNGLQDQAIIGIHPRATDWFEGRIRTSRTPRDIFMRERAGQKVAQNSVLCEDIGYSLSEETIAWAQKKKIPIVPFIGTWHYENATNTSEVSALFKRLWSAGIDTFMIDAEFEPLLRQVTATPDLFVGKEN